LKNMNSKITTLIFPINLTKSATNLVFIAFSFLSFLIPFSLGGPQWLVGTIVNVCLFLAAVFLPKKFFLPLIIFPSLGVVGRGIIFGPFTSFLVYFLPFIWLGNLILILFFKTLYKEIGEKFYYFRYFLSVFLAAAAKYLFLLTVANLYFKLHFVPAVFLQAMGISQLLTALAGGIISLIIFSMYSKPKLDIPK